MTNAFLIIIISLVLLSGILTITSKNPVPAVLFLVLSFTLSAIIFIILGAEFYSVLIFTVYVGAIAVLFLFVVMMLNLRIIDLYGSAYYYVSSGSIFGAMQILVLFAILLYDNALSWSLLMQDQKTLYSLINVQEDSNLQMIGLVLYQYCLDYFLIITLVLFIAMIGVIAISLEDTSEGASEASAASSRKSLKNLRWLNLQEFFPKKAKTW